MNQEDAEAEDKRVAEFARRENRRVLEAMHAEVDKVYSRLFELAPQREDGAAFRLHLDCAVSGYGDQATVEVLVRTEYESAL